MYTRTIRMCLTGSALATGALLAACSHSESPATHSQMPPAATASAQEVRSAVKDIVSARCDLEQRCNNVGAGQKFDNREMCESKLQGATADDLNTKDCPLGVDHEKLSACLSDIKAEDCGSPLDSLSRWNACRTGQVCMSD